VQHAVRGEQRQLVAEAVAGLAGLRGERGAEHDVPGSAGPTPVRPAAATRRPAVHRERHHVRGPGLVHPPLVQLGHHLSCDDHDRQLGGGVDAHRGEHVPGDGRERRLVHGDTGLVGHLDTHESSSLRSSPRSRYCCVHR
jgi:hypothetical protein